jgi:hypothetical protein
VKDFVFTAAGVLESETWNVTVDAPAAVGVPVIWPEELRKLIPAGSWPEARLHV